MDSKRITRIALITAVMCILSPFTIYIPISVVPVSLGVFTVFLGIYVLGTKDALIACLLYVLLGLVGLPVFSGLSGGPMKLFGPTGGYILGYFFIILISGPVISKTAVRWKQATALVMGVIACYILGTAWLAFQAHLSFEAALMAGVIPFIPADAIKIILIIIIGPKLKTISSESTISHS